MSTRLRGGDRTSRVAVKFDIPEDLSRFRSPAGVQARLQKLLGRQDGGTGLTAAERRGAEGLVDLAQWLTRLLFRAKWAGGAATARA